MKNIRAATKDLEIRKDKTMKRSETDDLWTKIESLNGFSLLYLP
jgi:hypothetical protein